MKHVPVTISDTAQPVPLRDAGVVLADIYDPVRERAVARRLRGARWRRLALVVTAVSISAAAAASFTLMNREMIQAELTPAPVVTEPAPAAEAPALASATSRPIQLPGAGADPNKVQARVIVPSDPEPQAVRPPVTDTADAAPQPEAPGAAAPRTIALSPSPIRGDSAAEAQSALPAGILGFAPVPAPRPSRAP
jgi:hypothetical protein